MSSKEIGMDVGRFLMAQPPQTQTNDLAEKRRRVSFGLNQQQGGSPMSGLMGALDPNLMRELAGAIPTELAGRGGDLGSMLTTMGWRPQQPASGMRPQMAYEQPTPTPHNSWRPPAPMPPAIPPQMAWNPGTPAQPPRRGGASGPGVRMNMARLPWNVNRFG